MVFALRGARVTVSTREGVREMVERYLKVGERVRLLVSLCAAGGRGARRATRLPVRAPRVFPPPECQTPMPAFPIPDTLTSPKGVPKAIAALALEPPPALLMQALLRGTATPLPTPHPGVFFGSPPGAVGAIPPSGRGVATMLLSLAAAPPNSFPSALLKEEILFSNVRSNLPSSVGNESG